MFCWLELSSAFSRSLPINSRPHGSLAAHPEVTRRRLSWEPNQAFRKSEPQKLTAPQRPQQRIPESL
ncbi:hypothetical protein XELAEV_18000393mg [Xenopus laevis]|uniref:Uncharacterized protein n=1 Tax=Xenopus laevis TaxID=8355 RepID=A0A974GZD5_XENLA|nr:hypothetical protein XELAEV_18000393mg [Xenopus laevis]